MHVVFISSETVPFAKTGGLADVAGSLPAALNRHGCRACVVTPFHKTGDVDDIPKSLVCHALAVSAGGGTHTGRIWQSVIKSSVPVYLIEHDGFFSREQLYGTPEGDYPDNAERFIFFCKAALELCRAIDLSPDVIHCNDWQTGLVPAYLTYPCRDNPLFQKTASLFTIHNIAYQGIFEKSAFALTGLPAEAFDGGGLEYWGKACFLKSGLMYADVLNTVSRKYAEELLTPEYGYGMDGILAQRKADLCAVLNGVDYEEWDPRHDVHIASPYSGSSTEGKRACKLDLLRRYGLPDELMDKPLIGSISRLADQKGFDLIAGIMDNLMSCDLGFVLLGNGDRSYHSFFSDVGSRYPLKAGIRLDYDDVLAHKIEAGCDIFLMPSKYEPCGLNQMYSLKYGTIPVVRATGGLDDTIQDCNGDDDCSGNGFKFAAYAPDDLLGAIDRALKAFKDKKKWRRLMRNAMQCGFSWDRPALGYIELYEKSIKKKRLRGA